MALLFLGKLLIAVGICYQAFMLFDNDRIAQAFDLRLASVLSSCDCIPAEIKVHVKAHLRMVIVGLLGTSALTVITRTCLFKFLVLVGLVVLTYINYHPFNQIPSFENVRFWESIAIIGGVIYLMGA